LSNHVPELPAIIESLGLTDYFCAIFNSAETGIEKPNPKAYQQVIDQLKIDPKESWMIGDNVVADVLTPQSLGIRAILVRKEDPRVGRCCPTLVDTLNLLTPEDDLC